MSVRWILILALCVTTLFLAGCPAPEGRGVIEGSALGPDIIEQREQRRYVIPEQSERQILFGDLHVHTTFSPDAFIMAAPLTGGTGLHPPADACDFARYCSGLDFWSINDHAEGLTPRRWAETRASVRECNAAAGDPAAGDPAAGAPASPDMVTFLGWEWSQVATNPAEHYGHKNVIFLDTEEGAVPTRAIASPRSRLARPPMGRAAQFMMSLMDFENRGFYLGIQQYYDEIAQTPRCADDVNSTELPDDCLEVAKDPGELFTKLDQWGFESIVIPHGNSWGLNTPASTSFDKQLTSQQHDPDRQILFEIYSGHGNAEEYRVWRAARENADGSLVCPRPSDDYMPCCFRAGEIIRERCEAAGEDHAECMRRGFEARQHFVDAGNSGHLTVPGQQVTDWLNCGTCPDCFNEPMDHRPAATAQYALAISGFEPGRGPLKFRFGFIGSSDNHRSQPGTGYKETRRKFFTESFGADSPRLAGRLRDQREALPFSSPVDANSDVGLERARNMERQNSFWLTGGLVATHSSGRDRYAIWDSLKRREVYATSGDRILLWFDMLRGSHVMPMGSEVSASETPRFKVSAMGAFRQKPGCPEFARRGLGAQRLETLCGGECYHPGDDRLQIDRIEIVRIRPQVAPGEPVDELIEDPWRTFSCRAGSLECTVEFADEDFISGGRETIYYARAIQESTNMINAENVRCEYDDNGECVVVNPCYGDYRTPENEDCLAPAQQRAWSSPIFVAPEEVSL